MNPDPWDSDSDGDWNRWRLLVDQDRPGPDRTAGRTRRPGVPRLAGVLARSATRTARRGALAVLSRLCRADLNDRVSTRIGRGSVSAVGVGIVRVDLDRWDDQAVWLRREAVLSGPARLLDRWLLPTCGEYR